MEKKDLQTVSKTENPQMVLIEKILSEGDLSRLSVEQRVLYYNKTCESLGLNPLTRPLEYIKLNGKITLYARKDCTEQLRKINGVSITKLEKELAHDVFSVTAYALDKDGRTDVATGAVSVAGLRGDAYANAVMKAETKAKRRVTLSISGMGFLDESELETIPDVKHVPPKEAEVEVIESKDDEKILADYLDRMNGCIGQDDLKQLFGEAWKKFENNPEARKFLKAHYDARKT